MDVGEPIVAVLTEAPEEAGFVRLDFAVEAWEGGARPPENHAVLGIWRTRVPEPRETARPLIEPGDAMALVEQLEDAADERALALRYLLTLQLIRTRKLMLDGSEDRGEDRVLMLRKRGEPGAPPVEVIDPQLDEQQLAEAAEQLAQLLDPDGDAS